jgi:hypothetical protein
MEPAMGLAMGAMIPLVAHGPLASAGLGFALAHLAVALLLVPAALLWPRARAALRRHRPWRMAPRMALGAGAGFALVCAHCLLTWHGTA